MLLKRQLEKTIKKTISTRSILLLGPRQTGKTTLLKQLKFDLSLNLALQKNQLGYERNPELLSDQIRALDCKAPVVYIDEIQKVPALMDEIQVMIDDKLALFCLTGSSARKLKKNHNTNLLPGRVDLLRMDPLSISEVSAKDIDSFLIFGSLPATILFESKKEKEKALRNYVELYLQEEIRQEALVRNVGLFSRFLELAAIESGRVVNFSKISQDVGVSYHTIQGYYSILEDCLIVERVDPISDSSTRKKLTKSSKYIFFDLGVRRVAAREPQKMPDVYLGHFFEQWVALEIIRFFRNRDLAFQLKFWSDPNGPEIDWIIEYEGKRYPIEVKWGESPVLSDAKHFKIFASEYENVQDGIIVFRGERNLRFKNGTLAVSHNHLLNWLEENFS